MAKSKIIKELVNNEISMDVALNRLLIIASDIENDELAQWAENELIGYTIGSELPMYRIIKNSRFVYSGINGNLQVENAPLPLAEMMGTTTDELTFNVLDGVRALTELNAGNYEYGRDLTAMAGTIHEQTGIYCTSIRQLVPPNAIENLIDAIKSKLLKVLIKLDKEYGSLDELDIDITQKNPEEVCAINTVINNYIFDDRSIRIGDKNRIESTGIGSVENYD